MLGRCRRCIGNPFDSQVGQDIYCLLVKFVVNGIIGVIEQTNKKKNRRRCFLLSWLFALSFQSQWSPYPSSRLIKDLSLGNKKDSEFSWRYEILGKWKFLKNANWFLFYFFFSPFMGFDYLPRIDSLLRKYLYGIKSPCLLSSKL